jgi:hypothetical protein
MVWGGSCGVRVGVLDAGYRTFAANDGRLTRSDSLYHRLFSHPLMVEQFVRDFVPAALALGLDFTRMERVNAKFHGRGGRRREGDVIWRVPTECGGDVYLYLMLEFQSQIDWWMPIRIQVYAGLLWQQIIDERKLKAGDRLPPVLPIVLYNGDRVWNAPTDTMELVALPPNSPLWHWQPQIRYHLVDEKALPGSDLERRESLVALLFRLEIGPRPEELVDLVDEVIGWFRQHEGYETLKQLFTEVVEHVVSAQDGFRIGPAVMAANDLLEIREMVSARFKEWEEEVRADALAKGIAEGRTQALVGVLSKQLRRRFGELPPDVVERIRSANADELDKWMDRMMDANSIGDVFDNHRLN